MKTLFQGRNGTYSSRRVLSLLFGLTAVIAAFCGVDAGVVIAFITASTGSQVLTAKQFEPQDNGTDEQPFKYSKNKMP